MAFVYILKSEKTESYYIGSTNDVGRRLKEHNLGMTLSLVNKRPLKVVFYQEYASIMQARIVERKLKKLKSRKIIERIVEDKIIKLGP